ncbi:hypothetical protein EV714DRAFT_277734 [Schizophyllum commune]
MRRRGRGAQNSADDAPTLADDAPTLADVVPTLVEDAPTLADDASTLADDAPTLADDASTLADDAPTLLAPTLLAPTLLAPTLLAPSHWHALAPLHTVPPPLHTVPPPPRPDGFSPLRLPTPRPFASPSLSALLPYAPSLRFASLRDLPFSSSVSSLRACPPLFSPTPSPHSFFSPQPFACPQPTTEATVHRRVLKTTAQDDEDSEMEPQPHVYRRAMLPSTVARTQCSRLPSRHAPALRV